jgi:hypothetical protein
MSNKKLAMSITTWMCVPEFGMKDLEVLCRGSAFLVPARAWNGDKTIVIRRRQKFSAGMMQL